MWIQELHIKHLFPFLDFVITKTCLWVSKHSSLDTGGTCIYDKDQICMLHNAIFLYPLFLAFGIYHIHIILLYIPGYVEQKFKSCPFSHFLSILDILYANLTSPDHQYQKIKISDKILLFICL